MPKKKPEKQIESEGMDFGTFVLEFIKSDQGNKILSRLFDMYEQIKQSFDKRTESIHKFNLEFGRIDRRNSFILIGGILGSIIICSTVLSILEKFHTPIGILFGTLIGFLIGREGFFSKK